MVPLAQHWSVAPSVAVGRPHALLAHSAFDAHVAFLKIHGSIHKNLRTNLARSAMGVSDFPFDDQLPDILFQIDYKRPLQWRSWPSQSLVSNPGQT